MLMIRPFALASRSLSLLRNMGAWVSIQPAQTYVATSIPGLGQCKSTYCAAVRRDDGRRAARHLADCQNRARPVSHGAIAVANVPVAAIPAIVRAAGVHDAHPASTMRLALIETTVVAAPQAPAIDGESRAAA